ncbi:unnamed protein product, partial [Tilletia controversa]
SQSTGKSTLLNKVFGTSFQVMDESQPQQTTKGNINGRRLSSSNRRIMWAM